MNEQFFQERYPEKYPGTIDADKYNSVIELFDGFVSTYADRPAFSCLGQELTYAELNEYSARFASFLRIRNDEPAAPTRQVLQSD